MSVDQPPHRPSKEELEGAKKLKLPGGDEHADATLQLAKRAFQQKSYDNAMAILEGLVIARPDDPRIYEAFGVVHQGKGEPDAAVLCFEAAVELDESTPVGNVNLGEIAWRRHKDAETARRHLKRVLARAPGTPFADRAQVTLRMIDKAKPTH